MTFWFLSALGQTVSRTRAHVKSIFSRIGAPIAHHRTEGPAIVLTFLGIQSNTDRFQLSLPDNKIRCLKNLLHHWSTRKACTRKDLKSLLGHLSRAATVIHLGRIFLHTLFSLLQVSNPSHFIRINVEARADIAWWQCLLRHWNGHSFFLLPTLSCHLYYNALGSFGCGALCPYQKTWFQLQWPRAWDELHPKSLFPLFWLLAALWGPTWYEDHVCFHSDNEAVVTIIQKQQSRPYLTTF